MKEQQAEKCIVKKFISSQQEGMTSIEVTMPKDRKTNRNKESFTKKGQTHLQTHTPFIFSLSVASVL